MKLNETFFKGIIQLVALTFLAIVVSAVAGGCSKWEEPSAVSDDMPNIFPDYIDVTVPCNIAPLNFMIEGAARVQTVISLDGNEILREVGKEGIIKISEKKWNNVLRSFSGKTVSVTVSAWTDDFPEGVSYSPFDVHIAKEEIDTWLVYRLIEPGYEGWRQLGIYQRDLSSFDEYPVVTNHEDGMSCLNCHNFPSYSSESMMFHARGANGGTVLFHDGQLKKIDFKSIGLKKNTTYPSWHPSGRYIAFSANTTHQVFYAEGKQGVEVFDTASDLTIYDVQTGEALTDPRFSTEDVLESFPSWSPEGDFLYFVSHQATSLPVHFSPDMKYDLLRVPFDSQTGKFGQKVDTLYDSSVSGGSVSYPRVSPDGRYLLYAESDYGTFPIWHSETDLKMMDLFSEESVDVSIWNDQDDADSYHSWSSNGRWVVFGTRRLDGRYTRIYIGYLDSDGKAHKPFLLPQEDPRYNDWRLRSYNIPELVKEKISLPKEAETIFCKEE